MATYLIVREDDIPRRVTIAEGRGVFEALEHLDLEDGEAVIVYRIAAPPRKVRMETQTVWKLKVV